MSRLNESFAPSLSRRGACVLALASLSGNALAQAEAAFPAQGVKLVVPFPPGGGSDNQARLIAERLGAIWKQPVNVENISGGGGSVAANAVVRSRPDGYTVFFATHPIIAINPFMVRRLPYDPVKDLTPVVKLIDAPLVLLVPASSPVRSIADLIKLAKDKPGTLNFGSGGIGTTQHLAGELLKQRAGIDLVHVPFRGNAQTLTALISNEIQLFFDSVPSALSQIKGGRVRGLAITSSARLALAADLPAIAETLPGFEAALAYGLLVPSATPKAVVDAINRDANRVLGEASYAARMNAEGAVIGGGTPQAFADFLAAERSKWSEIVKRLNIQME